MSIIKKIKPTLPAGFQDFDPAAAAGRLRMIADIRRVYELYGAVPLETSTFQRELVLLGTSDTSKRIYRTNIRGAAIVNDPAVITALRFDLTVPLARYVAANLADLELPFRRYDLGTVWRGDKPKPGRFRGFGQFDFDIVGALTGMADAEVIACMVDVMRALGVPAFKVRVNSRKTLNGLAEMIGFDPSSLEAAQLMRTMDKAENIGLDGVVRELQFGPSEEKSDDEEEEATVSEEDTIILGLDGARLAKVEEFLGLASDSESTSGVLQALGRFFGGSGLGAEGVEELKLIADLVGAQGISDDFWVVDPMVARGLDYYNGPVFETFIDGHREWGSVYSGGRFDYLVARFTGQSLPAVGASVGVDRFWSLVQDLGLYQDTTPKVDVFIIRFDKELDREYLRMAAECRKAGLRVEIYQGYQDQAFKHQLVRVGIRDRSAPIILIYGPDDAKKGTVVVKNTVTRKQESVLMAGMLQAVLTELGRTE